VVPLIWPAKNRPATALVSSEDFKPARIEVVVLDRVAGPGDVRVLEAGIAAHQVQLHVERQRGADAVRVDLGDVRPSGSTKIWWLAFSAKRTTLSSMTGSSAGRRPSIWPGVQRRAMQRIADDLVGALAGVGDPARPARMVGMLPMNDITGTRIVAGCSTITE
jgi:hypothetical protein